MTSRMLTRNRWMFLRTVNCDSGIITRRFFRLSGLLRCFYDRSLQIHTRLVDIEHDHSDSDDHYPRHSEHLSTAPVLSNRCQQRWPCSSLLETAHNAALEMIEKLLIKFRRFIRMQPGLTFRVLIGQPVALTAPLKMRRDLFRSIRCKVSLDVQR